jgi:hypothetical protein
MSRKKQVGLALVGIWLFGFTVTHLGIGGDGGTKAQARPAPPTPPPWALITKEQALRLAQDDDWRDAKGFAGIKTRAEYLDAVGQDWMESATSYRKVTCSGWAYWKLTFADDEPRPWYESKRQGLNVGFADCDTAGDDPRDAIVRHRSTPPTDTLRHGAR